MLRIGDIGQVVHVPVVVDGVAIKNRPRVSGDTVAHKVNAGIVMPDDISFQYLRPGVSKYQHRATAIANGIPLDKRPDSPGILIVCIHQNPDAIVLQQTVR